MFKYLRFWPLFLAFTLAVYGLSLRFGFSQDDFYFLSISQARVPLDFLKYFSPWAQSGFAFYRPLGTQVYYFLSVALAGFHAAPFYMHIFMLLVQSLNAYLTFRLVDTLTKDRRLALLTGLLYATSAVHFLSLFYIAATQQLLAAAFSLLSLNFFLKAKYWPAGITFALALLCKETAVVTPALAFLLVQYREGFRIHWQKFLPRFLPYLLFASAYALIRLSAGVTVQSGYHPVVNFSVATTLRWYWFFAYSAPELLLNYASSHMSVNFLAFIQDFGPAAVVTSVVTIALSVFTLVRLALSLVRGKPFSRLQTAIYLLWWLVGIFLVIWYPDHRYPHYLDLALIPLLLVLLEGLKPRWQYLVALALFAGSLASLWLSVRTHWTVQRAEMATRAEDLISASGDCASPAWDLVGKGVAPLELSYALSLENGPRVLCNNPHLQVYYGSASASAKQIDVTKVVYP